MTNDQLLQALQTARLLQPEAVVKLQREALLANRSVEDLIYERNLVSDVKIAEVKSKMLGVPYQKLNPADFDAAVLELIPEETARTYALAPLAKKDNLLVVGMVQPDDVRAQEALKFIANRSHLNLGVYLLSYGDWQDIMRRYSPYKASVENAVKSLNLKTSGLSGGPRLVPVGGEGGGGPG